MNILKMLCRGDAAAAAEIVVDAADFDGTNDYMARGAGLTGAADSKLFTFMQWFRMDGADGTVFTLLEGNSTTNLTFRINRSAANTFTILVKEFNSTTNALFCATSGTYLQSATWKCLMGSFDMADTAKRHLYVGDTSDLSVTTYTDIALDLTPDTDWHYGSDKDGTNQANMALAEGAFWFGQYLDLSVESNRRKLYSAGGKPVTIGADGSSPTGTAAIMYFHLDNAEAVANYATNRGSGGNFTITGTLDTASTS